KIHDVRGGWDADSLEYADKRALAHADLRPGDNANHKCEPRNVKKDEHGNGVAQGFGNGHFGVGGFARSASHHFDAKETEEPQNDAKANAAPAVGEKSAMRGVICETDLGKPEAKEQGRGQEEKRKDGHDFDHREPVFKRAQILDVDRVDVKDEKRAKAE